MGSRPYRAPTTTMRTTQRCPVSQSPVFRDTYTTRPGDRLPLASLVTAVIPQDGAIRRGWPTRRWAARLRDRLDTGNAIPRWRWHWLRGVG